MDIGFIYDFDLTLSEEFQQYPLFRHYFSALQQKYGLNHVEEYWRLCNDSELGVNYMQQMIKDTSDVFPGLTNEAMRTIFAPQVQLATGLPEWFERINLYAAQNDQALQHHVISVGITPLIEGTSIFPHLTSLTSGEFNDTETGIISIKRIVEPFRKVEMLKNLCKGGKLHQDLTLAEYPLSYHHLLVFGDGMTDRDKFRYTRQRGGFSIAVFEAGNQQAYQTALRNLGHDDPKQSSVWAIVPRDYSPRSRLEMTVKEALEIMLEKEKSCDMDDEIIRNWSLGHVRNTSIQKLVADHYSACHVCKEKMETRYYFK